MSATLRAHLMIIGKVQGVGFRRFTQIEAVKLGVTGWVRNVGYDEVECALEGDRPTLETLIEILRCGPHPAAQVEQLGVEWLPATGEFSSLEIRSSR